MRNLIGIFGLLLSFGAAAHPMVEMKTNVGSIVIELYPDKAPKTVENFLNYVNSGFYKGTIFHRVVRKFVVQGGGFTADLEQKPALDPIPNEATNGLTNEAGTLAMARAQDPNSATSQFFINIERNLFLNHYKPEPDYYGYCVFGKVIKGMDVVNRMAALPTGSAGPFNSDVPLQPIVIEDTVVLPSTPASPTTSKKKRKARSHG